MSYRKGEDEVYLVAWPQDLLLKVGVTYRSRWRNFVARGAVVLDLRRNEAPFKLGQQVEDAMRGALAPAFANRSEAASRLGCRGAGYTECYRASDETAFRAAVEACMRIMRPHHASASASRWSTDGRTDVLTQMHPSFRMHAAFRNAHAGVGDYAAGIGR